MARALNILQLSPPTFLSSTRAVNPHPVSATEIRCFIPVLTFGVFWRNLAQCGAFWTTLAQTAPPCPVLPTNRANHAAVARSSRISVPPLPLGFFWRILVLIAPNMAVLSKTLHAGRTESFSSSKRTPFTCCRCIRIIADGILAPGGKTGCRVPQITAEYKVDWGEFKEGNRQDGYVQGIKCWNCHENHQDCFAVSILAQYGALRTIEDHSDANSPPRPSKRTFWPPQSCSPPMLQARSGKMSIFPPRPQMISKRTSPPALSSNPAI